MDGYRIGLVIPALNEGMTIYDVVLKASKYGLPIVVDDGSIDSTGEKAKEAGAEVVRHKINLGYESALGSGFQRADELGCDVVITLDADGQHEPSLIRLFIEKIKQDYVPMVCRPISSLCDWDDIPDAINKRALHVAMMGSYDFKVPERRLYEVLSYRLISPMMKIYGLNPKRVKFHRDVSTNKDLSCPGDFADRGKLEATIRRFMITK